MFAQVVQIEHQVVDACKVLAPPDAGMKQPADQVGEALFEFAVAPRVHTRHGAQLGDLIAERGFGLRNAPIDLRQFEPAEWIVRGGKVAPVH